MFKFLNYLACTYFILLWSKMTEMTRLPRHYYSVTAAFCWASSTRPSINGQHDCVHEWRQRGSFWTSAVNNRFSTEPPDHKTGPFQSHPQSTEENALHFTCFAWSSLQGSCSVWVFMRVGLLTVHAWCEWVSHWVSVSAVLNAVFWLVEVWMR